MKILFFKNEKELSEKVKFTRRMKILKKFLNRFQNILMNGHDNLSRMKYWLDIVVINTFPN